jgi:hypothetical protein
MITAGELAYADAFFGVPGGVYALDARRLGRAYANGDAVRYAPDLLGRGVAVQDTLANRPLFSRDSSGLPQLDFISSSQLFMTAPEVLKTFADYPFAIFTVVERANDEDRMIYCWGGGPSSGVLNHAIYLRFRTLGRLLIYSNGTSASTLSNVCGTGMHIISHYWDGQNCIVRLNGVQVISGSIGSRSNVVDSSFFIGRQPNSTAQMLEGKIKAFISFRSENLYSLQEIQRVERGLAREWRLTL